MQKRSSTPLWRYKMFCINAGLGTTCDSNMKILECI